MLNDRWLSEAVLAALPPETARYIRLRRIEGADFSNVATLFSVATQIEATLRSDVAFTGRETRSGTRKAAKSSSPTRGAKGVSGVCRCCGQAGHWRNECPDRDKSCTNCSRKGHTAATCRTVLHRDKSGKVRATVEASPTKVQLETKFDRSRKDLADTGTQIMRMFGRWFEETSKRQAEARKRRKLDGGSVANVAGEEEAAEDVLEEDDSAAASFFADDRAIKVSAIVNGVACQLLVDTGSFNNLCNHDFAVKCGLRRSGVRVRFTGVGAAVAERSQPVEVRVLSGVANLDFCVFETLPTAAILGLQALRHLRLDVSVQRGELAAYISAESVAFPNLDERLFREEKLRTPDTVSGVDESLTDEALVTRAREAFVKDTAHLEGRPELREKLWLLLLRHQQCWLRPRSGQVTCWKASFTVRGPPIKHRLRRLDPEQRKELETQLESMLEKGVIRPSKSPWGASPVFVKKKTGGWRLCLDYRDLNKRMVSDSYPLPLLWPQLQEVAGHVWYVTLDCNWGFWNVPLEEESKQYTALVTHKGTFEFNVVPFGIKNSPGEFQRAIDLVLSDLYGRGVYTYIDDIVIYADDLENVVKLLGEVLSRCVKQGLYLKTSKCDWLRHEVKLLGHIVGLEGIRPNPEKVQAVRQAERPHSREELRSFLGLASYLRRFVPNFAEMAGPLNALTSPKVPYRWGAEEQQSFDALREAVSENVLLAAPTDDGEYVLMTDASNRGLGAVLLQMQDGEPVLLEFASHKFTPTEERWATGEQEAYAIVWSIRRFRDYLWPRKFTVLTDHANLQWMMISSIGKVRRWSLYLAEYDFEVKHVRGECNGAADFLSRAWPVDGKGELDDEIDEKVLLPAFTADEQLDWRQFTPKSWGVPTVDEIVKATSADGPEDYAGTRLAENGLRYSERSNAVYIPRALRETLLWWFHTSKYGGHAGVNRTIARMRKWVFWRGLSQDVKSYVGSCMVCLRQTPPRVKTLRGALSKPQAFDLVSLDYIGPRTIRGVEWYVLVVVDHASRYMAAEPTRTPGSAHAVRFMTAKWCAFFQAPLAVLTDRGAEFRSEVFHTYVTQKLGAFHVYSSAYYPQGNGINESSHRALEKALLAYWINEDADAGILDAVKAYNATPGPTGMSPYFFLFGQEPTFPGWQQFGYSERLPTPDARCRDRHVRNALLDMVAHRIQEVPEGEKVKVGDWVVYPLGQRERALSPHPNVSNEAYRPLASVPCKVVAVHDNQVTVTPLGNPRARRDVSMSVCRRIVADVPATLIPVAMDVMEYESPRQHGYVDVRQGQVHTQRLTWDQIEERRKRIRAERDRVRAAQGQTCSVVTVPPPRPQ